MSDDLRSEREALSDDLRSERDALSDDLRSERDALSDDLRSEPDALSGPNTSLTRLREKGSTDRAALDRLLDTSVIAHVGLVGPDGVPVVIPTAQARDGDRLLLHGSTGSGWMRRLADGVPCCVAVTAFDGLVVARSTFESSIHYRSAVIFGSCTRLEDEQKRSGLDRLSEALLPGRRAEVRPSTGAELAASLVLSMPLEHWSLKVSDGWPEDPDSDIAGSAWAGVVPRRTGFGEPRPAPDLRAGIDVPDSVRRFREG